MATDPYGMAADLLTRVAAYCAERSHDLPAQQYVAPGNSQTIAYDGPAVQVCVDYVSPGQPGLDQAGLAQAFLGRRYAQYAVTVLRECAAGDEAGNPPTAEQIQADAQANIADIAIVQAALESVRDGCRAAGGWAPRGSPVSVGRTQSVGPSGAVVAAVGVIQAEVSP